MTEAGAVGTHLEADEEAAEAQGRDSSVLG